MEKFTDEYFCQYDNMTANINNLVGCFSKGLTIEGLLEAYENSALDKKKRLTSDIEWVEGLLCELKSYTGNATAEIRQPDNVIDARINDYLNNIICIRINERLDNIIDSRIKKHLAGVIDRKIDEHLNNMVDLKINEILGSPDIN